MSMLQRDSQNRLTTIDAYDAVRLGANGIREPTTRANERLTDVAMFVFGLGDIFLAGYRTKPGVVYRSGHRLGYLNDAEYEHIRVHVTELRRTGHLQPTKAAGLEVRLKS